MARAALLVTIVFNLFSLITLVGLMGTLRNGCVPWQVTTAGLFFTIFALIQWHWRHHARNSTLRKDRVERDKPSCPMPDLGALHKKIIRTYNLEELRTLCFNLSISSEHVAGSSATLATMARELILYCMRCDRLNELIQQLAKDHPNGGWSDIPNSSFLTIAAFADFRSMAVWMIGGAWRTASLLSEVVHLRRLSTPVLGFLSGMMVMLAFVLGTEWLSPFRIWETPPIVMGLAVQSLSSEPLKLLKPGERLEISPDQQILVSVVLSELSAKPCSCSWVAARGNLIPTSDECATLYNPSVQSNDVLEVQVGSRCRTQQTSVGLFVIVHSQP